MNAVMSNKRIIALYVLPSLLLILLIIYLPILMTGYYGLMNWNGIGSMSFIGLDNYAKLVGDAKFWSSVGHSLLLALFSTISLVLYLIVAMVLSADLKGENFFRKVYLIPMLLSSVAIAQLWLKVYHPSNGILNGFLHSLGFERTPEWLSDTSLVLYAIFVPILWQYAGFYILIYYAALKNIPASIIEAARIDGAAPLQIALRIKLPLITEMIKVTCVLAVVGSLKYFDLIYVMTDGGPFGATEVMATYMYHEAFRSYKFGYGSSIAFFILLTCLVLTWLIRRFTRTEEEIQYS